MRLNFSLALTALPLALCAAPALAQEAPAPDSDPILVVGQKDAPIAIAPRGLSVSLGHDQLAAVNALNTEDLMKYAPNFFVRKRYAGDSNGVPGFRGTHSSQSARALVMVDGFVVSNFLGNSFGFAPKWGVVGPGEVEQFDIVYGPYSSRYAGNSMGGIVAITTRDPRETEAFATAQGFVQPYRQFATKDDYYGWSGEAGFGLRQPDGPLSVRVSARHFRNDGQPMTFLGLVPASGAAGVPVTGAVIDPEHVRATADGTGIPGAPGNATSPYFAAQSPARITQDQAKVRVGYADGTVTGEALFAFWHNEDLEVMPDCYLRDAAGAPVCEGRVMFKGRTYTASGANFSRVVRDEYLAGIKLAAPLFDRAELRADLSTYRIPRSDTFTSDGYARGRDNGSGTLARQGPTGWWTGDLTVEDKADRRDLAIGATANLYRTDLVRYTVPDWRSGAGKTFATRTFGKTRQLSAWAEARWRPGPLIVTAGTRYDDWRAFDGGLIGQRVTARYAARRDHAISPSLSIELPFDDATRLQLSLATATRFPTVGELYQGSLNGDGSFNADSFDPTLKPERSHDANLVLAHDFGPVKLTGSLFYQRVRDTIFSFVGFNHNGVTTSTFKNIDLTRQYGAELIGESHDWPIAGLAIDANLAWIDARTLRNAANPAAEDVRFPRIPEWRINANARYDLTPRVQASVGLRYASRPNTDLFGLQRGDTFGFTSELFALDVRVNWRAADRLRVSAGVDNLTDHHAWVFHPYPQRSVLVEAGWTL